VAAAAIPPLSCRDPARLGGHLDHVIKASLCLLAGVALSVSSSLATEVPLPRPRPLPVALAPVRPVPPPAAAVRAQPAELPQASASASPCTDLISEGIVVADLTHAMSGISGEAFCGDEAPVRLTAIRLVDGGRVELRPAALVRCQTAHTFARWVRDDLAAAAAVFGGSPKWIGVAASYSCRPRNNVTGAPLSEHGRANAIDVSAVGLGDGRTIPIRGAEAPAVFLAAMRQSACDRFTTVLGPGSDRAHEHHIHLDLARRRGDYRICQWNMPDWVEP
jgi:hypothetical protein